MVKSVGPDKERAERTEVRALVTGARHDGARRTNHVGAQLTSRPDDLRS